MRSGDTGKRKSLTDAEISEEGGNLTSNRDVIRMQSSLDTSRNETQPPRKKSRPSTNVFSIWEDPESAQQSQRSSFYRNSALSHSHISIETRQRDSQHLPETSQREALTELINRNGKRSRPTTASGKENASPETEESDANTTNKPTKIRRLFARKAKQSKADETFTEKRVFYNNELQKLKEQKAESDKITEHNIQMSSLIPIETHDGYKYERHTRTYTANDGERVLEIATTVQQGDGKSQTIIDLPYKGAEFETAHLTNQRLQNHINHIYHGAIAKDERKIEAETAAKYKELGPRPAIEVGRVVPPEVTRYDADRQKIADEKEQKIKEAREKADAAVKKFLEQYGTRKLDSATQDEIQWIQGINIARRDLGGRRDGAEAGILTNPEKITKIDKVIDEKIEEIKTILRPRQNTAASSSSSSHENDFEAKIKLQMSKAHEGLTDDFYKELVGLSTRPEAIHNEEETVDGLKVKRLLQEIRIEYTRRYFTTGDGGESLEKWMRYASSHYGKRLVHERELVEHLDEMIVARGELARAEELAAQANEAANRYYRGKGNDLRPISSDMVTDESESGQNAAPENLRRALEEQEHALLKVAEAKESVERIKAKIDKAQKQIEFEKGRDDADDAIELSKTNAIKKIDEETVKQARVLALKYQEHFLAIKMEDHKAYIRRKEAIEHLLEALDKLEAGQAVRAQQMKEAYWLALFGSGDQAALNGMGRELAGQLNSIMAFARV